MVTTTRFRPLDLLLYASCAAIACSPAGETTEPTVTQPRANQELSLRFVEYIRAPKHEVWAALTVPEHTRSFFHGTAVQTDLRPGGSHRHLSSDGSRIVIDGTIREVDAPNGMTFEFRFPEYDDAATLVRYALHDAGEGTTKLTVEHLGFSEDTKTFRRVTDGWPPVMSGLKTLLESGAPLQVPSFQTKASQEPIPDHPRHRFVAYIRTTPEALWSSLTDPAQTAQYFHGFKVQSSFQRGDEIRYHAGDSGTLMIRGKVSAVTPNEALDFSFERAAASDEQPSRVSYRIHDLGDGVCRLVVVHDFEGLSETYRRVAVGWPPILSGLKTLLETGEPLAIATE